MKKMLLALAVLLMAGALLLSPGVVAAGVKDGLSLSAGVLIPSLFPFMVLAGFLALSGAGDLLAAPLRPLTALLRLPPSAGAALLTGFVGGYPAGARTLDTLVVAGRLDRETAERMLLFCVNPGPSFVVIAVGSRMFGSIRTGWLLFAAGCLSSLTYAVLFARGKQTKAAKDEGALPVPAAFVQAVRNAAQGMLSICGFVVIFCAVQNLLVSALSRLSLPSWPGGVAGGILEVTCGCRFAATLGGREGVLLAAFLLSFSGISVLCQTAEAVGASGIRLRGFFRARLLCGAFGAGYAYLFLRIFGGVLPAGTAPGRPVMLLSADQAVGALCLCAMSLFLLVRTESGAKRLAKRRG